MICVIGFLALVASTLGCGVPQFQPLEFLHRKAALPVAARRPGKGEEAGIINGDIVVPHVVNGEEALPWPWQVSIQTSIGEHFCGGSLINNNWVLTAAHCLAGTGKYFVVLGQNNRGSTNEFIQIKRIAKAIIHPDYNKKTKYNNDVALLKLSTSAQMTSRVSPICLPSSSANIAPGTFCVTTGWGKTHNELSPRVLQQASIPIVSQTQCRQDWGQSRITDAMICAGGSGSSSCKGDSGGPLVCENSGVWYQVGIVSWGDPDCNVNRPLVYARVSYFRRWIDEVVRLN